MGGLASALSVPRQRAKNLKANLRNLTNLRILFSWADWHWRFQPKTARQEPESKSA
jgi:hypothetical protein